MDIKRIIKTIMALIVLSYFNGKYLSAQSTYKLFYGVNYIDPNTFNISPELISEALHMAQEKGLSPKAIIPVDLFGLPADYEKIEKFLST